MTSGRTRRSLPSSVCCSSKSQCSIMPASSTTRFNCSSPQRPRTPGRLSASTSRRVSACRSLPIASSDATRCSRLAPSCTRRRSASWISWSTRSSVLAIGASRSSIAFLRASMSAAVSVRACLSRVSARCRKASLFLLSAWALSDAKASRNRCLGVGVGFQAFALKRALVIELGLQTSPGRIGSQPAQQNAHGNRQHEENDRCQIHKLVTGTIGSQYCTGTAARRRSRGLGTRAALLYFPQPPTSNLQPPTSNLLAFAPLA